MIMVKLFTHIEPKYQVLMLCEISNEDILKALLEKV